MRIIPLLVVLLLLPACIRPVKRSGDPVARDQEIIRDICWKFRETRFSQVEVACLNGAVTLKGTVASAWDHSEAVEIARATTGVMDVTADLRVRSR